MSWRSIAFRDAFDIQLGKMLDKKKNVGELRPYLANRDVQWGKCDTANLGMMRFTEADRAKFKLQRGDLLVCEGGEVGRTAIWDGEVEDCYYQKAIHRLRPKLNIEPRFVLWFMRWAADRNLFARLTSTTSIAHLTKAKLQEIPISVPPLAEQKRIAGILDAADALRAKRCEALAQLDTLLQSTFLDMFGDPVTNPMGWEVVPVTAAVEGKYGIKAGPFGSALKKEDYVAAGYRIYGQEQVIAGRFDIGDYYIDDQKFKKLENCAVKAGDILVSLVGSYGKVLIVPDGIEPGIINPRLLKITPRKELVTSLYLATLIQNESTQRKLESMSHGGTMGILNAGLLKQISVPTPPLDLQRRFAAIVESVERQKARMRSHLTELDALFASLQDRAFKGEL